MVIAIDGYEANEQSRVGIGEYSFQLLNAMHEIVEHHPQGETSCRVYLPSSPSRDMPPSTKKWEYRERSPKKMWTFGALPLSLFLDRPQANVIFSPTHYIPRFTSIPRVMSIMDSSFLHYPELFNKKDYYQLVQWTAYSVSHARAIFTISEFSRNAIIDQYKYPKHHVFVTYPGFAMNKITTKSDVDIKKKYNLPKSFILSVGTLQPRKNFERLIEAFSNICNNKDLMDFQLIIVGKKGWLYESIEAAPKKYNVEERVRFLDFVSDTDLSQLYKEAECFVLPSLYEGFGLPILEAMANGCPVVVSNVSSLPEIAGDAGIYVDPENTESIAKGIEEVLKEKGTEKGKKRIAKGKDRVSLFSWEKAAETTLDVLEKVGKGAL